MMKVYPKPLIIEGDIRRLQREANLTERAFLTGTTMGATPNVRVIAHQIEVLVRPPIRDMNIAEWLRSNDIADGLPPLSDDEYIEIARRCREGNK
jgi:hypothetical protein